MFSAMLLSVVCGGGICSQSYVVRQKVAYSAPYVAPVVVPNVFYFTGASVRAEAIVQKELQSNPQWHEFQEFLRWKESQAAAAPPAEAVEQNAVQHFCAKCHGTTEPKGGFYMDGAPGMTAEAITRAIRMIATDKMPPPESGHRLTREEKNALLTTLLSLEASQNEPPPQPEPNPQGGSE
jgi:mono/diheme cytochrome c family protein